MMMIKRLRRLRKSTALVLGTSLTLGILGAAALGLYRAAHSDAFVVRSIVVTSSQDDPPLTDQEVIRRTHVMIGRDQLFELNLKKIENLLLESDLIQEVRLQKKIPNELQISVEYRKPVAMLQLSKRKFAYLDPSGKVFDQMRLDRVCDLPLLTGVSDQDRGKALEVVQFIQRWENSSIGQIAFISSVHWDAERGYRALIVYSLNAGEPARVRTMIDIGPGITSNLLDDKLSQLLSVLRYLSKNSVAASRIHADIGKKIMVKTAYDGQKSEKGEG